MKRAVTLIAAGVALWVLRGQAVTVFSDDFEYDISRTDSAAVETFVANGWTGAKTEGDSEPAANGWLYTSLYSSISGGCGTSPNASSRALVIEAKPATEGGQTDFYLQLGNGSSGAFDNYLPANLWVQFWTCTQDTGGNTSDRLNRNKFLYVCNGTYGCSTHLWMISESACNYVPPYSQGACSANSPTPEFFWNISSAAGVSTMEWAASGVDPGVADQWGQNIDATPMPVNAWRLVKMNIDTSGATGRARIWVAAPGGAFALVMDHQDGLDDITFTYPTPGGHRELRMPTTVGHASDPAQQYDYWMYMDDFTIASTEGDLPTYSGGAGGGGARMRGRLRGE